MAKSTAQVGAQVSWGVQDSVSNGIQNVVQGVVTGFSRDREAMTAPCENEIGQRIGERVYDYHAVGDTTVMVAAGTKTPASSSKIAIEGVNYICRRARIVENNKDYRKISLTLEAFGVDFSLVEANGIVKTNAKDQM